MLDVFLVIIILLSLGFIIWRIIKKFSLLININVDNLPEVKIQRQKDAILKNRLERSWMEIFSKLQVLASPAKSKLKGGLKQYYKKLKDIEKDLRRRGFEKLSSSVDRSQAIDEILTSAKQHINNEEYRLKKEYSQARETLEYLLKLTHAEDPDVYYSLADIAKERGNLKQAEEEYIKSISLSDDNYLYLLSLAEVYIDLEEEEKALETAKRALLLAPNNPKILDFLINISIIMSDKELASDYLAKLKEVNPANQKIAEFIERIDSL
jgi:tetratricopeptide (TPR) repeat protein